MSYLIYTSAFLIYLLIQAIFINGVYISAAGKSETLPDGTGADSEMILYPLYKFLSQNTEKRIYYILPQIKLRATTFPTIAGGVIKWDTFGPYFYVAPTSGEINIGALIAWADAYLGAKVEYDEAGRTVAFYKTEPQYKFSKYLRKPIITCVICMASFWSIFTFLIPVLIVFGFSFKILPIWIGNVFCLSYLNYVIFKPRK